jgi:hypothetical protein
LFAGGIIKLGEGSVGALLLVALVFGCAAVFARSALLSALAVLALAACLGARTGYLHAMYFLGIEWPTLTIVVFTLLGALLYELSKHVPVDYRSVVTAAARTSVFLVNFGFWIGSLWGDHRIGPIVKDNSSFAAVWAATWVFALLWAIALLAAGIWAWKRDRRWLVNVVAIFGAIDFYTQWFERLGASPRTVLIAGLAALAFAIGLRAFNAKSTPA